MNGHFPVFFRPTGWVLAVKISRKIPTFKPTTRDRTLLNVDLPTQCQNSAGWNINSKPVKKISLRLTSLKFGTYYTSKVHKNINHTYKKRKSVTNYFVLSGTMNALHIPDRCVILRQHYYYGKKINIFTLVSKWV